MANFLVTNTDDSGAGSLRAAIAQANATAAADTITFSTGVAGFGIRLLSGELTITNNVTIDGDVNGDNVADVGILGEGRNRIFNITGAATDVDLVSLTMRDAFVIRNPPLDRGGAILATGIASLDITDCTISGCRASLGGAIFTDSPITLTNSLLANNHVFADGGAMYVADGVATLRNTTIYGNSAYDGGGGIATTAGSRLVLLNSTVTHNRADANGDGAGAGGGVETGGRLDVINSVVADNLAGNGVIENDIQGFVFSARNSVFGTATAITTNIASIDNVANVGLGPLGIHGGPVPTQNILPDSILINRGSNASAASLTTDANGNERVVAATVDVGATEFQLVVTTAKDVVKANDGVLSLREALALVSAKPAPGSSDTITFAPELAGQTIVLTGGRLGINRGPNGPVTVDGDVDGDNKADITISGNNTSGIFGIGGGTTAELLSLNMIDAGGSAVTVFGDQSTPVGGYTLSDATLRDCTISNSSGLAIFADQSDVDVINSLITGNNGGGIFMPEGFLGVIGSTIHGNTSDFGGGGISIGPLVSAAILHSAIAGNRADADGNGSGVGGGVEKQGGVSIINSVIAGNFIGTGTTGNDLDGDLSSVSATYSVFGTPVPGLGGTGNQTNVGDVGLGDLLDNGGTVLTRSPRDGSILIGAGDNASVPRDFFDVDGDGDTTEPLPIDGRGGLRIVGGTVDVGAVEQVVDETIGGTAGNDRIAGGLGDDVLRGRAGNDTLDGGAGDDRMSGEAGNDTYFVDSFGDVVSEFLDAGNDTVNAAVNSFKLGTGVERVNFTGSGNFVGSGNALGNRFAGGAGNDRFVDVLGGGDIFSGGGGTDAVDFRAGTAGAVLNFITGVFGGAAAGDTYVSIEKFLGSDTGDDRMSGDAERVIFAGFGGDDRLNGGALNDQLLGGAGDDLLNGKAGRDALDGGAGNDTMTGGGDGDVFVFATAGFGQDIVTDYQDGLDVLKIHSAVADDIADFTIAGNGTASVTLSLNAASTNTITLNGLAPIDITAADFVFY